MASELWQTANLKTVSYCTLCVVLVGFVLLLAGAILSGIAYTEIRPNYADENYDRYIKANVNRVVGPIMLAFGLLNIIGGCAFFGVSLLFSSKNQRKRNKMYNVRANEHLPDMNRKMLSEV